MKKDSPLNQVQTMQLEDFVATSLSQIVKGIAVAQQEVKETSVLINPIGRYVINDKSGESKHLTPENKPQIIEFDVAVTATSGDQEKGGIGVFIGDTVGIGVQAQTSIINSTISRINFSIPVYFPPPFGEKVDNAPKRPEKQGSPMKKVFGNG